MTGTINDPTKIKSPASWTCKTPRCSAVNYNRDYCRVCEELWDDKELEITQSNGKVKILKRKIRILSPVCFCHLYYTMHFRLGSINSRPMEGSVILKHASFCKVKWDGKIFESVDGTLIMKKVD